MLPRPKMQTSTCVTYCMSGKIKEFKKKSSIVTFMEHRAHSKTHHR